MKEDNDEQDDGATIVEHHEDGTKTYHLTGTVPMSALTKGLQGGVPNDQLVQAELPLGDVNEPTLETFHETFGELIPLDVNNASGNWPLEVKFAYVLQEAFELFKKKHKDYGANNLVRFGLLGIIVRMSDKMSRLEQLVNNGGDHKVEDETMHDTFIDFINYATAAILFLKGDWK